MREALFWRNEGDKVRCELCPHYCLIGDGRTGRCRVRRNEGGVLWPLNYGKAASVALDPIEKKPLYHFHPGRPILSLGTNGCNFACKFCQNWELAEAKASTDDIKPADVPPLAKRARSVGVAYTYNEPFVWYEFVLDAARLCKAVGLKNVLVTNGFVNAEPLEELMPFIDALNIDIKSVRQDFHDQLTHGKVQPVLETCRRAARTAHVEITTLVIPGYNDSDEEFEELASWICNNLGTDTVLHLSAYFPRHRLDAAPTPAATLLRARNVCLKRLKFVYLGNVASNVGADTFCPKCNNLLVERVGLHARMVGLSATRCGKCGEELPIIVD